MARKWWRVPSLNLEKQITKEQRSENQDSSMRLPWHSSQRQSMLYPNGEMANPVLCRQLRHLVDSKTQLEECRGGNEKGTVLSKVRPPGMTQCSKTQIPIIFSRATVSYITRMANLVIPLHKDRTDPVLTNDPRPTTLGILQGPGHKTINNSKSWFSELTIQKWESTITVTTSTTSALESTAGQVEMGDGGQAGRSHRAVGKRVWGHGILVELEDWSETVKRTAGKNVLHSRQTSNKTRVWQEERVCCVPATARARDAARERMA